MSRLEAWNGGPASFGDNAVKRFTRGTHRVRTPDETLETVFPLARELGVTRLANITGLDIIGIPVAAAIRPGSRSLAVSQGKGITLAAAKVSALMESLELLHAEEFFGALRVATWRQLGTAGVIDIAGLARAGGRELDADEQLLWVLGHDLLNGLDRWVPFEVVHASYTREVRSACGVFSASSNGLASGNHILEAVIHALLEVIERDATTLWECQPTSRRHTTRLDCSTVSDPDCQELLGRIRGGGLQVALFDTTSDVGAPSFYCTLAERGDQSFEPMYAASGMGCHVDPGIALARAITEAAQSRLTAIAGSRDDLLPSEYERSIAPEVVQAIREHLEISPGRAFDATAGVRSSQLEDDLAWLIARLEGVGVQQIVVVDLTRDQIGLPVVRVVVPGLEGPVGGGFCQPGARARAVSEALT